jgi:hypothetical protein
MLSQRRRLINVVQCIWLFEEYIGIIDLNGMGRMKYIGIVTHDMEMRWCLSNNMSKNPWFADMNKRAD